MGRPTKYKPEYCQKLIDFFDKEVYEDVKLPHYGKDGSLKWEDIKRMPNKLPTIVDFAKSIKVGTNTVRDWKRKKHPSYQEAFSVAYAYAKELQKNFIIQNGLQGLYNPGFAIFVAKNITDMKDVQENKHTGGLTIKIEDYGRNSNNPTTKAEGVPQSG